MVQKNYKLSVYIMLLAWMVITVHQVIPHDHHSDNETVGNEQSCPLAGESSEHHKGLPLHCHAFNDLSSEKIVKFVPVNYLQQAIYLAVRFTCSFNSGYCTVKYPDTSPGLTEFYYLNFFSLRSPPFFS